MAAGPCTQGEAWESGPCRAAPLGSHPGRRGRVAGASGSGGFPSEPAFSEPVPLSPSWVIFQREEVGLGCLRLLRTALVPLAINPEGAGRLLLSLSVLTVTGLVFCLKLLTASSSGWLVRLRPQGGNNGRLHGSLAPPLGLAWPQKAL